MGFDYRELEPKDGKNLFRLFRETLDYLSERYYPGIIIDELRSQFDFEYIENLLLDSDEGFALGCFEAGTLIGFVWGWTEESGLLYLEWAGIDKKHMRSGIMTRFLEMSEKFSGRKNIHKIYFRTYIKNIPAARCYLESGYGVEGVFKNHAFGGDFVQFGKILQQRNWKSKIDEKLEITDALE
jgi:RimJ/RimL family protein N-acetyltransferase